MGTFCSACADVQVGKPVVFNMETADNEDDGLNGSLPDFDSRRTRFGSSDRSHVARIFKVKSKSKKLTEQSPKTKIKYAPLHKDSDSESDSSPSSKPMPIKYDYHHAHKNNANGESPAEQTELQAIDETTPEKRNSNTTISTIATTVNTMNTSNTMSTMHSMQTNHSTPVTVISITDMDRTPVTTITYAKSELVHKINKKHAFHNTRSADSALTETDTDSDDEDDESSSTEEEEEDYDDTPLTSGKWQQQQQQPFTSIRIPFPRDLALSQSMPSHYGSNKPFSHRTILYKLSTPPTTKYNNRAKTFTEYNSYRKQEDSIAAIFYQLTSLKKLDTASQINVILDEFLTDYSRYDSHKSGTTLPYNYLFRNDIIGNLIFAWNLGVQKINSTLITYSIQSLCKFTHREAFRKPFLAEHGINLIDKTLSIPSLQPQPSRNSKPNTQLSCIESAESVDLSFKSNSFSHILAVLKITRDICRLDVIDTMLWCSSKVHQKVLSTMKRDYDEVKITKACRKTLIALLDASYEISEEIIHDQQIHKMIDSFLESTKKQYLSNRAHAPLITKHSGSSIRSIESITRPLFVYNNTETSESRSDADNMSNDTVSNKKHIKHVKKKNLLQLELLANSQREEVKQNTPNVLRTMSAITDCTEQSEKEYEDEEEYETEEDTEDDEEDGADARERPQPKTPTMTHLNHNSREQTMSLVRTASSKSAASVLSDDTASVNTHICYERQSEVDSILSLKDYDAMVKDAMERMSDIDEVGSDTQFELLSDYHDEEKLHTIDRSKSAPNNGATADVPSLGGIQIHSLSIDEDEVKIMEIKLTHNQLLYINSLFHILYKIITVKKAVTKPQTLSRPTSTKKNKSFMELLQNRKKRERQISGGTAGGLSQMDAVYMSDSEAIYRDKEKAKLKQINHEQNKLLESFFASLSFKNLFKLLKYYQLNSVQEDDGFDSDGSTPNDIVSPFSAVQEFDEEASKTKMASIEKLACKILRKILSYSQIVTDKLLIDEELDVIGILVTLAYRHSSNIDLIIYILDIFSKITKDNEDIRDLLLTPEHFDTFLCALDPWWVTVIESTQKLAAGKEIKLVQQKPAKKPQTFLHLELLDPLQKLASVDSIGVADDNALESDLQIEVTIAMLKFFKLLSESNALDMVEYGINDRILVLLDYYLNISLKYDPYQQTKDVDGNLDLDMNYSFVFSHDKHQQCLSLCLECIQNLATDINMLLEFVFNKTVEKLTRICWSFRDHTQMMKKCCDVINKLLKLEQSCKQIANQNVLQPLIHTVEHIFEKTFISTYARAPQLLIASELFPAIYTNEVVSADEEEDIELVMKYNACEDDVGSQDSQDSEGSEYSEGSEDSEDEDAYDDDGSVQFVGSEDEHNDDEIRGKDDTVGRRVRFHRYDLVQMNKSMSFSNAVTPTHRSHEHLRDLKDIFNVLMSVSYVDKLCVEIIESNLMLLLIECIANKSLMIHNHMMISLIVSDLLQHLTKNKKGAETLIHSNRFQIVPFIVDAIENNINNRGVVLKYLRALIHLKDANHERFKKQLEDNECIGFLKKVGAHFHEMINVNEIIEDYEDDNEDKLDIDNDDDGDNEEI